MKLEYLHKMIDAHGGLASWERYNRIVTTLQFGGLAFKMKFRGGKKEHRFIISMDHPMVVVENFPKTGRQGVFTPESVWIETFSGRRLKERLMPREVIQQWPHSLMWDDLDLLYFAGYACWNYFNTPFLFARKEVECRWLTDWVEKGRTFKRLKVSFPDQWHVHCKEQVFYFDQNWKLSRFDYDPEVFSSWARAAQYCYDYKRCGEFWLPAKRRVVARSRNRHSMSRPTLVWINVKEIHFQ